MYTPTFNRACARSIAIVTALILFITLTAFSQANAGPNNPAFISSHGVGNGLGDELLDFYKSLERTVANREMVQSLLENGATGTVYHWKNPDDDYMNRANPQPPHPQADGTILREIEVESMQGRWIRVLYKRDLQGKWERQSDNLRRRTADRKMNLWFDLANKYGWWTWSMMPKKDTDKILAREMAKAQAEDEGKVYDEAEFMEDYWVKTGN